MWNFFEIDIIPLFTSSLSKIAYVYSKMIFLCTREDSILSSSATESDGIMT